MGRCRPRVSFKLHPADGWPSSKDSSPNLVSVRARSLLPPPRVLGAGEHSTQSGELEQKRTTGGRGGGEAWEPSWEKAAGLVGLSDRKEGRTPQAGQDTGQVCPTALPADPDFLNCQSAPEAPETWHCVVWLGGGVGGGCHTSPELSPNPGSGREKSLPVGQELGSLAWL